MNVNVPKTGGTYTTYRLRNYVRFVDVDASTDYR